MDRRRQSVAETQAPSSFRGKTVPKFSPYTTDLLRLLCGLISEKRGHADTMTPETGLRASPRSTSGGKIWEDRHVVLSSVKPVTRSARGRLRVRAIHYENVSCRLLSIQTVLMKPPKVVEPNWILWNPAQPFWLRAAESPNRSMVGWNTCGLCRINGFREW
jgi:hypothetical protein